MPWLVRSSEREAQAWPMQNITTDRWAVVKLVVDHQELLDLALSQALHVEVLPVLFRQLRFWLVEALQFNQKVVRHAYIKMRMTENEPGMAEHSSSSGRCFHL
jgi:hypothetical protein